MPSSTLKRQPVHPHFIGPPASHIGARGNIGGQTNALKPSRHVVVFGPYGRAHPHRQLAGNSDDLTRCVRKPSSRLKETRGTPTASHSPSPSTNNTWDFLHAVEGKNSSAITLDGKHQNVQCMRRQIRSNPVFVLWRNIPASTWMCGFICDVILVNHSHRVISILLIGGEDNSERQKFAAVLV